MPLRPTTPFLLLAATVLVAASPAPAVTSPLGLVPGETWLHAQVVEPVFAWVCTLVEADSLGAWTAADVEAFADGWGRPSDFPLAKLVSFRREALPEADRPRLGGLVCDRRIVIELDAPRLDMPMPYSILGYHPGTLSFGSPVVVDEWRLGRREVTVRDQGGARPGILEGVVIFSIEGGWTILDVDGWLDTLLGETIDDASTLGFGLARGEGRLLAVSTSVGREGRYIFGELDLRTNEVAAHGEPLAKGMAGLVRRWSRTEPGRRDAAWQPYESTPP